MKSDRLDACTLNSMRTRWMRFLHPIPFSLSLIIQLNKLSCLDLILRTYVYLFVTCVSPLEQSLALPTYASMRYRVHSSRRKEELASLHIDGLIHHHATPFEAGSWRCDRRPVSRSSTRRHARQRQERPRRSPDQSAQTHTLYGFQDPNYLPHSKSKAKY
jgi:hypothetical protein